MKMATITPKSRPARRNSCLMRWIHRLGRCLWESAMAWAGDVCAWRNERWRAARSRSRARRAAGGGRWAAGGGRRAAGGGGGGGGGLKEDL
jgi:hypothetical protein